MPKQSAGFALCLAALALAVACYALLDNRGLRAELARLRKASSAESGDERAADLDDRLAAAEDAIEQLQAPGSPADRAGAPPPGSGSTVQPSTAVPEDGQRVGAPLEARIDKAVANAVANEAWKIQARRNKNPSMDE